MRWLQFIFSHSIFIAVCAVALCFQSYILLHKTQNFYVYGVIFFSTLCSYNFYWLISKYSFSPIKNGKNFILKNISYIALFLVAAVGMFICLYFVPAIWAFISLGVLLTLLYSLPLWPMFSKLRLYKAGFIKTTLLAFTWSYVTTVVPLATGDNMQWNQIAMLLTARFFFMLMLCAIFDMRDLKIDKMHALHSLATDIKARTFRILMILFFGLYLLAGVILRYEMKSIPQFYALLVTGCAVWIIYFLSTKSRGYLFYYFGVDGLMLFSGIATYVATFFEVGS